MTLEQEEKICLFCLESRKGRRQHLAIEFKGLFPCECVFQSHAECIIKWQLHCLDELQCPICRVYLIVPDEEPLLGAIVVYQPIPIENEARDTIAKKYLLFVILHMTFVCLFFLYAMIQS